jgi:hypothetical protein
VSNEDLCALAKINAAIILHYLYYKLAVYFQFAVMSDLADVLQCHSVKPETIQLLLGECNNQQ